MPQGLVKHWHEKLGLPAAALDGALEAAVLEAKINAVWGWADAVADGTLGRDELQRLADALGSSLWDLCGRLGTEATEKAEVSEEHFRAKCREHPPPYEPGRFVEGWFRKLELPLLPREAGCLDFCCA